MWLVAEGGFLECSAYVFCLLFLEGLWDGGWKGFRVSFFFGLGVFVCN